MEDLEVFFLKGKPNFPSYMASHGLPEGVHKRKKILPEKTGRLSNRSPGFLIDEQNVFP